MKTTALDDHLARLYACRACPAMEGRPVTGAVAGARVLLVGQAPGPREGGEGRPFAWTAGRRLFAWFASIGAAERDVRERVYIAAVARCFPGRSAAGGDRAPSPEEIERCGAHLDAEIRILEPELVITVGTHAAGAILGRTELASVVGRKHRATRAGHAFDVVALPHPSGRSTWTNREENRKLLEASLRLIGKHPAWRDRVASRGLGV
ncbi:MAG TPA: uracil-DNA glycosylase family protein [Thermoanaerobaculia bacterium]